jgi:peptidoglycan-associated lipoprotein
VTTFRSLETSIACAALLVAGLALSACRTTPEAPPVAREIPEAPAAEPRPAAIELELGTVYFDYDSAALRSDATGTLKKNADTMRGAAEVVVTLEGHCDERGSEEYNLALGERRAEAVRKYLVDLGIPGSRLRVVSFGEAKPAVMGHDESAWKWNRRVEAH